MLSKLAFIRTNVIIESSKTIEMVIVHLLTKHRRTALVMLLTDKV